MIVITLKLICIHVVIDDKYFYLRLYFVYTSNWWWLSLKKRYSKHSVDNEWCFWNLHYTQCENDDVFFYDRVIDDDEIWSFIYTEPKF